MRAKHRTEGWHQQDGPSRDQLQSPICSGWQNSMNRGVRKKLFEMCLKSVAHCVHGQIMTVVYFWPRGEVFFISVKYYQKAKLLLLCLPTDWEQTMCFRQRY
jgi:hypothetical protein